MSCLLARRGASSLAAPATALLARACPPAWGLCRAFKTLPIIDVGPLMAPGASLDDKLKVGRELDDACSRVGFFYAVNHGLKEEVLDGVRDRAREWFALPLERKREILLSPKTVYRGFQELGENVTRYEGGFQRDHHEAIDLYKEAAPSGHEPRDLRAPNPWPTQVPGFRSALDEYVDEMSRLGAGIMRGIGLGLGVGERYFEGPHRAGAEDSYWCIRVIHYPPLPKLPEVGDGREISRAEQLSCGEHTDYGLLTVVNQDSGMTALQVKNAAGEWVDAAPVEGALVCNVGDMLKVWTNGRYMPTLHRVIHNSTGRGRISVPFFFEPCYDTVVAPLEGLGGAPSFPPVRYADHLCAHPLLP
mmetsp:Transcript_69608/g.220396  ORF Transcript_69608/g.220396 Transcript_69608/m.220396 type:complete len:360 (+) Transcript_69608:26-1105(+)